MCVWRMTSGCDQHCVAALGGAAVVWRPAPAFWGVRVCSQRCAIDVPPSACVLCMPAVCGACFLLFTGQRAVAVSPAS